MLREKTQSSAKIGRSGEESLFWVNSKIQCQPLSTAISLWIMECMEEYFLQIAILSYQQSIQLSKRISVFREVSGSNKMMVCLCSQIVLFPIILLLGRVYFFHSIRTMTCYCREDLFHKMESFIKRAWIRHSKRKIYRFKIKSKH